MKELSYSGKIAILWKRIIKLMMKFVMIVLVLGILSLTLPRIVTGLYSRSRTYSEKDVPLKRAVIVFGAGLWRDGSPTPVLRDRVLTGVNLYLAGKVEKILMSGDNRMVEYNEPFAMRDLALSLGVPENDIVLDYAGRRTYDTCYRAKEIFGLTEAILVTQSFHITRALYTCNQLGIDAVGVSAKNQAFRKSSLIYWNMRESLATIAALWDVHIGHPIPVLGEYEPIFP
jgi:vancomycin permeability regulator SanA